MLLALSALTIAAAAQDVETLTYRLTAGGQAIGQRTLTVTWLPSEAGEVRLLESYTELELTLLGKEPFSFTQRLGGRGRVPGGSFSSVIRQSDGPREIQALRREEGWRVTVVEPGRTSEELIAHRGVDATSLTLVDPGAWGFLDGLTRLSVLSAETGTVLSGPLLAGGEVALNLGGTAVPGQVWTWQPPEGSVELVYGLDGHLLRYTMQVAGVSVRAELTEPPEGRRFEEQLDLGGLIDESIQEQDL